MQGYQYNKTTNLFTIDVPNWDGEQQPIDPDEAITSVRIDNTTPRYQHKFDEATQTWGEGMPQAEIDALVTERTRLTRISEIETRLNAVDLESVRALRSSTIGRGMPADTTRLNTLEDEAETLRTELTALQI